MVSFDFIFGFLSWLRFSVANKFACHGTRSSLFSLSANLFFYRNLVYPVTRGQFTAAASQNLAELWRGSNSAGKRELLDVVSLNRMVSDTSVVLKKEKAVRFSRRTAFHEEKSGRQDLNLRPLGPKPSALPS